MAQQGGMAQKKRNKERLSANLQPKTKMKKYFATKGVNLLPQTPVLLYNDTITNKEKRYERLRISGSYGKVRQK